MARIRSIKPEFWADDKIVDLTPIAKLLYIGMWNFADDDGYMEASHRRIKRLIFPDNAYNVEKAIDELVDSGVVVRLCADQGNILSIPKFRDHQKPQHPTPTKFTGIHEDSGGLHEDSLRSVVEGSGIVAPPKVTEEDFDLAYTHWPKKTERAKSFDKFKRVAADRGLDIITADIIKFGDAYARHAEKQFVPALVVWLNGERWTDELPGSKTARPEPVKVAPPTGTRWAADVINDPEFQENWESWKS